MLKPFKDKEAPTVVCTVIEAIKPLSISTCFTSWITTLNMYLKFYNIFNELFVSSFIIKRLDFAVRNRGLPEFLTCPVIRNAF